MLIVIAILVFIVVALGAFAIFSLLDERSARARVLRERLSTDQETAERKATQDLALVRDEMLSRIPAFDTLLRRSERVSALQKLLAQADLQVRAGNFLLLCVVSGVVLAAAVLLLLA